ncbi:hypothetical protein H2203_007914 [Taxawa tesnikishii (nom. ined.)]|nr:hypothetical protein H2203_007914 [Dothideales sp. JES 119]
MGRLYAIADIHLSYPKNQQGWADLQTHPNDALILAGDCGEKPEHLEMAFSAAVAKFAQVFWVPGNHELYTTPRASSQAKGEAKYHECVSVARRFGVLTPEDEWAVWEGEGGPAVIALCFTLYDYTFRPAEIQSTEEALAWAEEENIKATDEVLLYHEPYPSREAWCEALVAGFEKRLQETRSKYADMPLVVVNHWPLREDLVWIPRIPRFSLWCGTKKTEDWPKRFKANVVVTGHLHVRRTDWKEGIRYEEVSLGYPGQWQEAKDCGQDINTLLREILPGPKEPVGGSAPTQFRRYG